MTRRTRGHEVDGVAMKYVIAAILAWFVYLFLRNRLRRPKVRPRGSPSGHRPPPGEEFLGDTVRDPACGAFLTGELAIKKTVGGEEYYFCSEECFRRFLSERQGG
jgi:YHS domain-containing protein